jgi:hypothetical protein
VTYLVDRQPTASPETAHPSPAGSSPVLVADLAGSTRGVTCTRGAGSGHRPGRTPVARPGGYPWPGNTVPVAPVADPDHCVTAGAEALDRAHVVDRLRCPVPTHRRHVG